MKTRVLGHGPPLVMVPGWGMRGAVWTDLAEAPAPRWRVCFIDLPGHGDNRGMPFGTEAAGHLVAAAPAGAVWLGSSLGGKLALSAPWGRRTRLPGCRCRYWSRCVQWVRYE